MVFHSCVLEKCFTQIYTPNASMADHSVSAQNELHESEASQSLMFCFDNVSPEKGLFRCAYELLCS